MSGVRIYPPWAAGAIRGPAPNPFPVAPNVAYDPVGDGSETFVLALSASSAPGTSFIVLRAGEWGGLMVAPDSHPESDTATFDGDGLCTNFDDSKTYVLALTYYGAGFYRLQVNVYDALDTNVPAVVSATIYAASPDALVIVWDRNVVVPSVQGFSLDFSVGGPVSITSVVSGNGTDTTTLALSDAFDGTETCSFVVANDRTAQSIDGPLVATGSTSVSFVRASLADWGLSAEWRVDAGRTGDPVSALAEQILGGGTLDAAQATAGDRPDYQAGPPEVAVFAVTDLLLSPASALLPAPDDAWTMVWHGKSTSNGTFGLNYAMSLSGTSGVGLIALVVQLSGTVELERYSDAPIIDHAFLCAKAGLGAVKMTVIAQHDGAGNFTLWTSVDQVTTTQNYDIGAHPIVKAAPVVTVGGYTNINGTADFIGDGYHWAVKKGALVLSDANKLAIHNLLAGFHS